MVDGVVRFRIQGGEELVAAPQIQRIEMMNLDPFRDRALGISRELRPVRKRLARRTRADDHLDGAL